MFDAAGHSSIGDEQFESLFARLKALSDRYPLSVEHRRLLAIASARCHRRLEDAALAIEYAIRIDAKRSPLYAALAEVQLSRGDSAAATRSTLDGLRLDPSDLDCRALQARLQP